MRGFFFFSFLSFFPLSFLLAVEFLDSIMADRIGPCRIGSAGWREHEGYPGRCGHVGGGVYVRAFVVCVLPWSNHRICILVLLYLVHFAKYGYFGDLVLPTTSVAGLGTRGEGEGVLIWYISKILLSFL